MITDKQKETIESLFKPSPSSVPPNNHYNGYKLLRFIQDQGYTFAQGCVIKYVDRFLRKDGKKDLLKARDYIDQLIAFHYPEEKCEPLMNTSLTDPPSTGVMQIKGIAVSSRNRNSQSD